MLRTNITKNQFHTIFFEDGQY